MEFPKSCVTPWACDCHLNRAAKEGFSGTPDVQPAGQSTGHRLGWRLHLKLGGGRQSYRTEPLACGIWHYFQVDGVRIELNCGTLNGCQERCRLVWGTPPSHVRTQNTTLTVEKLSSTFTGISSETAPCKRWCHYFPDEITKAGRRKVILLERHIGDKNLCPLGPNLLHFPLPF